MRSAQEAGGHVAGCLWRCPGACPNSAGAGAGNVVEDAAESAETSPPGIESDLGDGQTGVAQQRHRTLDTPREQVTVRRNPKGLFERPREMGRGHATDSRQASHRPSLLRGGVHPVLRPQQAPQQFWTLAGRAHGASSGWSCPRCRPAGTAAPHPPRRNGTVCWQNSQVTVTAPCSARIESTSSLPKPAQQARRPVRDRSDRRSAPARHRTACRSWAPNSRRSSCSGSRASSSSRTQRGQQRGGFLPQILRAGAGGFALRLGRGQLLQQQAGGACRHWPRARSAVGSCSETSK